MPPPRNTSNPSRVPDSLRTRTPFKDVAELLARAGDRVADECVGVRAEPERGGGRRRRIPETGRDSRDDQTLLRSRSQPAVTRLRGDAREALELFPGEPAQRRVRPSELEGAFVADCDGLTVSATALSVFGERRFEPLGPSRAVRPRCAATPIMRA